MRLRRFVGVVAAITTLATVTSLGALAIPAWAQTDPTPPSVDNLPANLEGSRLAEKLQAITEIDLDELQAIDPPRGYGRD